MEKQGLETNYDTMHFNPALWERTRLNINRKRYKKDPCVILKNEPDA